MNLILLSGNGNRNPDWLPTVERSLAPSFETTSLVSYRHWQTGDPEIDLDYETTALTEKARALQPYAIFAKSAGSIVVTKSMAQSAISPQWCLFAGLPLVMIRDHQLPAKQWLETSTVPITIVQNDNDPYGSFREVQDFVSQLNRSNITVIESHSNTHDYTDFELLQSLASDQMQHYEA